MKWLLQLGLHIISRKIGFGQFRPRSCPAAFICLAQNSKLKARPEAADHTITYHNNNDCSLTTGRAYRWTEATEDNCFFYISSRAPGGRRHTSTITVVVSLGSLYREHLRSFATAPMTLCFVREEMRYALRVAAWKSGTAGSENPSCVRAPHDPSGAYPQHHKNITMLLLHQGVKEPCEATGVGNLPRLRQWWPGVVRFFSVSFLYPPSAGAPVTLRHKAD